MKKSANVDLDIMDKIFETMLNARDQSITFAYINKSHRDKKMLIIAPIIPRIVAVLSFMFVNV